MSNRDVWEFWWSVFFLLAAWFYICNDWFIMTSMKNIGISMSPIRICGIKKSPRIHLWFPECSRSIGAQLKSAKQLESGSIINPWSPRGAESWDIPRNLGTYTLPKTNIVPLKIGHPKKVPFHLPTTDFQGLLLLVTGRGNDPESHHGNFPAESTAQPDFSLRRRQKMGQKIQTSGSLRLIWLVGKKFLEHLF